MLRRRYLFFLLLLAVAVIAGCGRKTMPLPPQSVVPVPVSDLSYALDENGLSLSWSMPVKLVNGDDLDRIEAFQVFRAMVPLADYCPGCPLPFELFATVAGGETAGDKAGFAARYHERDLRPGFRYFYKVRPSAGRWFVGRDSELISFAWDSLPPTPADLQVAAGDRKLMLSWPQPAALADGRPLSGILYQVYRSEDGVGFAALVEPLPGTGYADETVVNGRRYYYKVRAVRRFEETLLTGAAGPAASGVPKDLTPPAPPLNLVAVNTDTGVRLSWEGGNDEDLAGFRIYRRRGDAGPVLAGEVRAPVMVFTDTLPRPGGTGTWYYAVSAFDREPLPNESVFSGEAEVKF